MKLSRNVLVGSLAVTGMVLGAVAPAVTAQAATTTGKVDSNGNVTGTTVADGKYTQVDAADNGGLAIAYDNGKDNTVGSASMESNANVKVINGLLVLNAVPDFGFGSAAMGTKVGLESNKYDQAGADSTNADAVKITESRTDAPGFSLAAQIGHFTASSNDSQDFTLSLLPTSLTDSDGNSASSVKTSSVSMSGKDTTPATLLNLDKCTYNVGQINASFAPSDKNVFLKLGETASSTTPDKASVKSYNANITWTLTAKPTSDVAPDATPAG